MVDSCDHIFTLRLYLFWRKTFSRNDFTHHCVFSCAWKIKFSRKTFPLTMCFMVLTRKLVYISIFTTNHFRVSDTQRERERERERERDLITHSTLTRYSPSSLTRTPLRSHIQASASRILAPARSRHEPTNRSTHHLQIDPPRPPASHTHELISLCPSLTIGLVILIFLF